MVTILTLASFLGPRVKWSSITWREGGEASSSQWLPLWLICFGYFAEYIMPGQLYLQILCFSFNKPSQSLKKILQRIPIN